MSERVQAVISSAMISGDDVTSASGRISDTVEQLQALSGVLGIQKSNYFRIDRGSDWKRFTDQAGNPMYAAPSGDIWETASGPYVGTQYFTLIAAERETRLCGRSILWGAHIRALLGRLNHSVVYDNRWQEDSSIQRLLHLIPAGFYDPLTGRLYCRWLTGHYWISESDHENSHSLSITPEFVNPHMASSRDMGFCILCE